MKWMKRLLSDRALDRLIAKDYGIKAAASNS